MPRLSNIERLKLKMGLLKFHVNRVMLNFFQMENGTIIKLYGDMYYNGLYVNRERKETDCNVFAME